MFTAAISYLEKLDRYLSRPVSIRVVALLVALLGLYIRIATTGWYGLERDEAQMVNILADPNLFHWLSELKGDGNAPLAYLVFWPVVMIFGNTDIPVKILAVAISSLLPPLGYLLFAKRIGPIAALVYALLLAVHPTLIKFGDQVRCYGLAYIIVLLVTYTFAQFTVEPVSYFKRYALVVAASLYTHLFCAVILVGQGLFIALRYLTGKLPLSTVTRWFGAIAVAAAVFSPWMPAVFWQLLHHLQPWSWRHDWWNYLFYPRALKEIGWINWPIWTVVLLALFLPAEKKGSGEVKICACTFLGAAVSGMFLTQGRFGLTCSDRYVSMLLPVGLFLFVNGCRTIACFGKSTDVRVRTALTVAAAVPPCLLIWCMTPQIDWLFHTPQTQVARLVHDIDAKIDSRKDLVVVSWEVNCPEVTRKLDKPVRIVCFPDLEAVPIVKWDGIKGRIFDDGRLNRLYDLLDDVLNKQHGSVWLIGKTMDFSDDEVALRKLDHFNAFEDLRVLQISRWLKNHARQDGRDVVYSARESNVVSGHFLPN